MCISVLSKGCFKMFGAMHFIYYINRSIAMKVESTYLGYWPTPHSVCLVVSGGHERVTSKSQSPPLSATLHMLRYTNFEMEKSGPTFYLYRCILICYINI